MTEMTSVQQDLENAIQLDHLNLEQLKELEKLLEKIK